MGFGLVIGYLQRLQIVTTSNYSTLANSCTLRFTAAHTKSSQSVFCSGCQVTDPNSGLFCLHCCWLATVSHLTPGSKCPHILDCHSQVKVCCTTGSLPPFESHDQRFFFFQLNPCSHSPYVISILFDKKMGLSLVNMLGLSSSVRITHIACCWKFFLFHCIQVLCQYRLCKAGHAYLTYLTLQWQLSHLNGCKVDHCQVKAYNSESYSKLCYGQGSVSQSLLE
jgi:hypothetical protein